MAGGQVFADASDFSRLGRAFDRLPADIRQKAFRRTMARLEGRAKTEIVRDVAKFTSAPQKHIRPNIRARSRGEYTLIRLKTRWLSWEKLGARQLKRGVSLRRRGRVPHAFFATMASGHRNVFVRSGPDRTPIHGLYGPNPAHAVNKNHDRYADLLVDIVETEGARRLLHEIDHLLRRF